MVTYPIPLQATQAAQYSGTDFAVLFYIWGSFVLPLAWIVFRFLYRKHVPKLSKSKRIVLEIVLSLSIILPILGFFLTIFAVLEFSYLGVIFTGVMPFIYGPLFFTLMYQIKPPKEVKQPIKKLEPDPFQAAAVAIDKPSTPPPKPSLRTTQKQTPRPPIKPAVKKQKDKPIPFTAMTDEELKEEYNRISNAQNNLEKRKDEVKKTLFYKLMAEYEEKLENIRKESSKRNLQI